MTGARAYLGAATTVGEGSPAAGITTLDVDGADLTPVGGVEARDPTYLALSADGRVLYAAAISDREVRAWSVAGTDVLPLGEPRAAGRDPCHLSIHPSQRFLLTACYGSGSLVVHPIEHDGSLGPATDQVQHAGNGPHATRQDGPHAHMVVTDPETRRGHVLAADLGTDTVYRYTLEVATGRLAPYDELRAPPGAGPRHLVIGGAYAYVANELDSTVTVFDLDAGAVASTVSTRPAGATEVSAPSAIRLSGDGRFLYVANRGVDEIAVLTVAGPALALVGATACGVHPRDIACSPDGRYLYSANQFGGTITTFRIDNDDGTLTPIGEPFRTPSPTCLVWE